MNNGTYFINPKLNLLVMEKEKNNNMFGEKPFSPLKIHFCIIDNVLIMQILEQDPTLFLENDLLFWKITDDVTYYVSTVEHPEIDYSVSKIDDVVNKETIDSISYILFLRGTDSSKNHFKGCLNFQNEELLNEFIDNFKDLLDHNSHLFDYEITSSNELV